MWVRGKMWVEIWKLNMKSRCFNSKDNGEVAKE